MGEAGSFGGVQCGQCAYTSNNNHIKQLFIYFFSFWLHYSTFGTFWSVLESDFRYFSMYTKLPT